MTRYAAENYSLREENRHLRSLESIRKAEEAAGQAAVELEEAFQLALEAPKPTDGNPLPPIKKQQPRTRDAQYTFFKFLIPELGISIY